MIQNNAYLLKKEYISADKGGMERVLVVDDEENIAEVVSLFLKSKGYFVSTAKNGEDALKILKEDYYDLVISDIRMPKMDGLALLKETTSLYDMSEAISSGSNLNEIFRIGINAISREVDADAIALYLKNEKNRLFELKIRGFKSKNEKWSEGFIKSIDENSVNKFFKDNRAVLMHGKDILMPEIFIERSSSLVSIIAIPLKINNKIIGVLNAYSFKRGHIFTEGQKKSLLIFSNSIAAAVETTRLYDNLQQTFKEK